jgi:hypothetical protein
MELWKALQDGIFGIIASTETIPQCKVELGPSGLRWAIVILTCDHGVFLVFVNPNQPTAQDFATDLDHSRHDLPGQDQEEEARKAPRRV